MGHTMRKLRLGEFDHSEALVKQWVKELLKKYDVYYFMPVQGGIGAAGLDFHCVVQWRGIPLAFWVETKKFGKEPTDRQELFIRERKEKQNAKTFIVDGRATLNELEKWLEHLKRS